MCEERAFIRRSQLCSLLVVRGQHEGAGKNTMPRAALRLPSQSRAQAPDPSAFGNSTKFSQSGSFLRKLPCCLHELLLSLTLPVGNHCHRTSRFPPPTQAQVRSRLQTSDTVSQDRNF